MEHFACVSIFAIIVYLLRSFGQEMSFLWIITDSVILLLSLSYCQDVFFNAQNNKRMFRKLHLILFSMNVSNCKFLFSTIEKKSVLCDFT